MLYSELNMHLTHWELKKKSLTGSPRVHMRW